MSWTNYHGHCHFCDGKGAPEDYVKAALSKGMKNIGFSSHAPVPFDSFWNMQASKMDDYLLTINGLKQKYNSQIDVLLSLEIDYIPNVMGPSDEQFTRLGLDYTIGSVHFMGFLKNKEVWAIDGSFESFVEGVSQIYNGDYKKVVTDFYELQKRMLIEHNPTIIGHLDKIKMHNATKPLFDESASWYQKILQELLELISETGTIVEINTKSLSRNGLLFPDASSFKKLKELNIPIVINSDCHYPEYVDAGFSEVSELLFNNGISKLAFFKEGNWEMIGFNEKGYIL